MMTFIKLILKKLNVLSLPIDVLFSPLTIVSGLWFKVLKFIGLKHFPVTKSIFFKLGFFPIVNHYYEPRFDFRDYKQKKRKILGINFQDAFQLDLLRSFSYQKELISISNNTPKSGKYYYDNGSYPSGDSECYYSMIRKFQPSNIIEIGSGFSTLIAFEAINKNNQDNLTNTDLICIEPYEMPWLDNLNIKLIREKVENIKNETFKKLKKNDILFIDSSHIIRPNGDVLYEIFEILPNLNSGVLIHFHDIFTPFDYPQDWLKEEFRLWNEQYLLEAFLSYNDSFEVILAMTFMTNQFPKEIYKAFPVLGKDTKRIPGSFWIRKK
ncbi:class I SAM-dependent methyltransferase [Marivirga sp.]|uniref:class I SAM-dependent methyltransferase n=1 Tax=Marivirga sp. TaxID=2018662 RepID=UPI002D7ED379|nr:class I SAM-dependent methyltransferase [Marivirga sp.]HET8861520.1 class I SAM-dependent methyltransferase [Marivirga sp.]